LWFRGDSGLKRYLIFVCLIGLVANTRADPEIMVHQYDVASRGTIVASLHANYVANGQRESQDTAWPLDSLGSLMAEFATGLAPNWEVGIHLAGMRAGRNSENSQSSQWGSSALIVRLKYAQLMESGFFFGANVEYGFNAQRYIPDGRTAELRGILGFESDSLKLTINPLLVKALSSNDDSDVDFNMDFKALHKLRKGFAWGCEMYTDWGKLNSLNPGDGDRIIYLVGEFDATDHSFHFGIGRGFKETPEHVVLKAVWSRSF
jgi:hypothetical protein